MSLIVKGYTRKCLPRRLTHLRKRSRCDILTAKSEGSFLAGQKGANIGNMREYFDFSLLHGSQALAASLDELRIIQVVAGNCTVTIDGEAAFLRKSDYLLVNIEERAFVEMGKGSYVAVLSIDYYELCRVTERWNIRFYMNSAEGNNQYYAEMRFMLQGLLMCLVGEQKDNQFQAVGLSCLILQGLISHFALQDVPGVSDPKERKAQEILQYVRSNFRSNISITDIAKKLFLSRSAASRMFKQITGENFPVYLKRLRLQAACKELKQSDRSISELAVNSGFSTPSAFSSAFREEYGLSPKEYRELHRDTGREEPEDETMRQQVCRILENSLALGVPQSEEVEELFADLLKTKPCAQWKNRVLNVGPFHSLMSAGMQKHILFLQERLDIEYLRMWTPFSRQLMVFGRKPGELNFSFLDEILDFCVDHRFKLFFDLTPRMDRALASENREIYGSESQVEFASEDEWLDALDALLSHLRARYHDNEVNQWVFELTFSLNDRPYYKANDYAPLRVWQKSFQHIRSAAPGVRIAGPGLIHDEDSASTEAAIRRYVTGDFCPDIFTSIHFPYKKAANIFHSKFEKDATRFRMDREIREIRLALERWGFSGEYWITEWGISLANRNYLQDSCHRGAAILNTMMHFLPQVDSISVFYASDLLNAFSDTDTVLSGSGGLLSRNGIRKPAYYSYRFIHYLGSHLVAKNGHCTVTTESSGDIRAVCWNRKNLGPVYYLSEEDSFRPDEIDGLFENNDTYLMELVLTGLKAGGDYRIRQRILNQKMGSVLDKWVEMGYSTSLSRDDIEYLERITTPEVSVEQRKAEGGELRLGLRMDPNEIRLITITEEK